jgi:hypothetical protein
LLRAVKKYFDVIIFQLVYDFVLRRFVFNWALRQDGFLNKLEALNGVRILVGVKRELDFVVAFLNAGTINGEHYVDAI